MPPSITSEEDHDSLIHEFRLEYEDDEEDEDEREGNDIPVWKELPVCHPGDSAQY